MNYLLILAAGFAGGLIRGLVGFLKHQLAYKNVKFEWFYFLGMICASGLIGLVCALAMKELGFSLGGIFSPALSFIVGYAGGDFIENIYKIIIKQSSLYTKEGK